MSEERTPPTAVDPKVVGFAFLGLILFMALIFGFCYVGRHRVLRCFREDVEAQPTAINSSFSLDGVPKSGGKARGNELRVNVPTVREEGPLSSATSFRSYSDDGRSSLSHGPNIPPGLSSGPVQVPPLAYHPSSPGVCPV